MPSLFKTAGLGPALLLCLFLLPVSAQAQQHPFDQAAVRHPGASFIDLPTRMRELRQRPPEPPAAAGAPSVADCASEPMVPASSAPMQMPPHYASGSHGPRHPDYEAAVGRYRAFEARVARLANGYLASGQAADMQCLLAQLDLWARADELLNYSVTFAPGMSNQAWFQAEWSVSAAALALSLLPQTTARDSDPERHARIVDWMRRVSAKSMSYPGGPSTCCNNHAYWRGLHATMVGVLANDAALFRWGLGRYHEAMLQLAADGSWPLEMARREQALHYQNYALQPLVLIAEIAAQQGIDLYAHAAVPGRDLHAAVRFLARAVQAQRSQPDEGKPAMNMGAFAPGQAALSWAVFYRARFGQDPLGLLTQRLASNPRTGGEADLLVGVKASNATATASAAAGAPARPIDLSPWKLTVPDAKASEVSAQRLLAGYADSSFKVEPGGSLWFAVTSDGGHTTNARYPRSELREMLNPDDRTVNWGVHGVHRIQLRQELVSVPPGVRVVVHQIHAVMPDGGHAPPLIKVEWLDGKLRWLVKERSTGGKDIRHEVPGHYPLGQAFDAGLEVRDGQLLMTVDGHTLVDNFIERDPGWHALRYYFKAGNYLQHAGKSAALVRSVVRIHALSVDHPR